MNLKNIAIIMDGNGRWAKKNNLQIKEGHARGVSALKEIVKESVNQNIESLTVYAFSTENWKRPKSEVKAINNLIVNSINNELDELIEQKVKVRFFGDYSNFGKKTYEKIKFAEEKSFSNKPKLRLNVALGYGGKMDIINIAREVSRLKIKASDINDHTINELSQVPESSIDLLIRTGGDTRISNFLLYQIAYSEIHFVRKLWPDYSKQDFKRNINKYFNSERRFGERT
ncbi:MAG: ditrans,polycis-undecaprenyl-diphosphate synthase [Gammaproteobacteria bacterium]|jgi:undecaprenyl diphosphate synthase|nr:MAG: ditrans,polycis-undecaprenyl-diphosphate synthase [Gammaproteobacteria bacterium]|tara:strand:- start:700 stop:1386 length:687 start_codon:yes stop_codon:yes gene_type:complete